MGLWRSDQLRPCSPWSLWRFHNWYFLFVNSNLCGDALSFTAWKVRPDYSSYLAVTLCLHAFCFMFRYLWRTVNILQSFKEETCYEIGYSPPPGSLKRDLCIEYHLILSPWGNQVILHFIAVNTVGLSSKTVSQLHCLSMKCILLKCVYYSNF